MKNKHKTLGQYLKEARINADLSQFFVADKLGYTSPQFISNFERGLCSPPLKQLKKLVKLYNLNPQELIELMINDQTEILNGVFYQSKKNKVS